MGSSLWSVLGYLAYIPSTFLNSRLLSTAVSVHVLSMFRCVTILAFWYKVRPIIDRNNWIESLCRLFFGPAIIIHWFHLFTHCHRLLRTDYI